MIECKNGISFVIPAKNEEKHIADTIYAIKQHAAVADYEIIVIDNNSIDATASIARDLGATVIHKVGGTIGAARNAGVALAKFSVIVFIDADVSLTVNWEKEILHALSMINDNSKLVTGSHCIPPVDGNWLERNWFQNFSQKAATVHLGTGHLIMSQQLFQEINGFDENLRTGEDYDICQRARAVGANIVNNEKLQVIHRDYPQNVSEFIKREIWHGVGDFQSVRLFLRSKVAVTAVIFVALHVLAFIGIILGGVPISMLAVFGVFSLCLLSSIYKFKQAGIKVTFINSVIFYFYYWGRFLSAKAIFKNN